LHPISFLMSYMLHAIDKCTEVCNQKIALVKNETHSYMVHLLSIVVYREYRYLKDVSVLLNSFVTCEQWHIWWHQAIKTSLCIDVLKLLYHKTIIEICIQTSLYSEISSSLSGESGNWNEVCLKLLLHNQMLCKGKYNLTK
jgi:hypothetical protein